jgi:hypothetical protein
MPDGIGWTKRICSAETFSPRPQALHGLFDHALRAAPADHQHVTLRIAVHRRRLQRFLQGGELQATHAQAFLVGLRVVGDLLARSRKTVTVCMPLGWPGEKRRAIPVNLSQS